MNRCGEISSNPGKHNYWRYLWCRSKCVDISYISVVNDLLLLYQIHQCQHLVMNVNELDNLSRWEDGTMHPIHPSHWDGVQVYKHYEPTILAKFSYFRNSKSLWRQDGLFFVLCFSIVQFADFCILVAKGLALKVLYAVASGRNCAQLFRCAYSTSDFQAWFSLLRRRLGFGGVFYERKLQSHTSSSVPENSHFSIKFQSWILWAC